MEARRKLKTEHGGPKHTKGYWGPRQEAKQVSKKARRWNDKAEAQREQSA
jgi:hypothetical protein